MMNTTRREIRSPHFLSEWVRAYWRTVLLAVLLVALSALAGVIVARLWVTW